MQISVDLKSCEACGKLYYRPKTKSGIYCDECAAMLCDFPAPESRKLRGRKSKHLRTYAHPCTVGAESQL
jgi:hypothetical protein